MLKKIPHTYVIVFSIIVLSAILTWIIPGGAFDRHIVTVNGIDRNVVIPGSFHYVDRNPQTWQIFSALFDGFVDKADIIVFILIIGGAFWIMNESKAIDVAIRSILRFTKRIEHNRLISGIGADNLIFILIMLMFSVFGAVFGMSEETIAFVIIFVPLAVSMGYDSIVGVSLCFVAAALGFAGAILNPFTIGIAQGLSNLPLFSGIEYRMFCWGIINFAGIFFILRYARRIKKNPGLSGVFRDDEYWKDMRETHNQQIIYHTPVSAWVMYGILLIIMVIFSILNPMTNISIGDRTILFPAVPVITLLFGITGVFSLRKSVHFFILLILLVTILFLITGVMGYGWYIMEIATLFFAMGLAAGISMNYSANKITKLFLDGIKDIQSAAIIVGLAGGLIIILNNGNIIDTMLYKLSRSISGMGRMAAISMMYAVQTLINLVMPSGSAKAALTMPMMSQFSDLIGVSRQATVMAFQFGDGFTNMITPTSGVLLGVLSVARIPYEKWFRWVLPFIIMLTIIGFFLLIPTVYIDLNGF
ncbi:MAG: short-chain fatty acid transporter [Bacteroidetes bacterium RBG_13_43_22]|nr:MAG: short-chain fatty acid transporter [Bacteroidetes bacterium RBG_13_43_22]